MNRILFSGRQEITDLILEVYPKFWIRKKSMGYVLLLVFSKQFQLSYIQFQHLQLIGKIQVEQSVRIEDQHYMQNLNDSLNNNFEENPQNLRKKKKNQIIQSQSIMISQSVQPSKPKKDQNETKKREEIQKTYDEQQYSLQADESTKVTKQEVDTLPITH